MVEPGDNLMADGGLGAGELGEEIVATIRIETNAKEAAEDVKELGAALGGVKGSLSSGGSSGVFGGRPLGGDWKMAARDDIAAGRARVADRRAALEGEAAPAGLHGPNGGSRRSGTDGLFLRGAAAFAVGSMVTTPIRSYQSNAPFRQQLDAFGQRMIMAGQSSSMARTVSQFGTLAKGTFSMGNDDLMGGMNTLGQRMGMANLQQSAGFAGSLNAIAPGLSFEQRAGQVADLFAPASINRRNLYGIRSTDAGQRRSPEQIYRDAIKTLERHSRSGKLSSDAVALAIGNEGSRIRRNLVFLLGDAQQADQALTLAASDRGAVNLGLVTGDTSVVRAEQLAAGASSQRTIQQAGRTRGLEIESAKLSQQFNELTNRVLPAFADQLLGVTGGFGPAGGAFRSAMELGTGALAVRGLGKAGTAIRGSRAGVAAAGARSGAAARFAGTARTLGASKAMALPLGVGAAFGVADIAMQGGDPLPGVAGDKASGIGDAFMNDILPMATTGAMVGGALTAWLGPGAGIGAAVGGGIGGAIGMANAVFGDPETGSTGSGQPLPTGAQDQAAAGLTGAQAKAIIKQRGSAGGSAVDGLQDFVAIRLAAAMLANPQLRLVSGYRSNQEQAVLYDRYQRGQGPLAAKPGQSKHNQGLAIDVAGPKSWLAANSNKYKLVRSVPSEDWHFEPVETAGARYPMSSGNRLGDGNPALSGVYGFGGDNLSQASSMSDLLGRLTNNTARVKYGSYNTPQSSMYGGRASAPAGSVLSGGGGATGGGGVASTSALTAARAASAAGFAGQDLVTAVAVAMGESSLNAGAFNGTGADQSYGLWQINMQGDKGPERRQAFGISSNEALYDPGVNARAAMSVYNSQGWGAWSVHTDGSYRQHLSQAQTAVASLGMSSAVSGDGISDHMSGVGSRRPGGGVTVNMTNQISVQQASSTAEIDAMVRTIEQKLRSSEVLRQFALGSG